MSIISLIYSQTVLIRNTAAATIKHFVSQNALPHRYQEKNIAKPTHTTEWDKYNIIAIISIF